MLKLLNLEIRRTLEPLLQMMRVSCVFLRATLCCRMPNKWTLNPLWALSAAHISMNHSSDWWRNRFCQLEMSDDYSPPQRYQWGLDTQLYLLQFRGIQMFLLFCFRHQRCACEVCLKHFKNACYVPGGDATITDDFCTNTISQLALRCYPCLFPNICKWRDPEGVVERRQRSDSKEPGKSVTRGHAFIV